MRIVFAGCVLFSMCFAVLAVDVGEKDKKGKDKTETDPKKFFFKVSNVRLKGDGNADYVPVNDKSKKVFDNDAINEVVADLVEMDGFKAVEAKFKIFPTENLAKMAKLEPEEDAMKMDQVPRTMTWKGMNAPFTKGAAGTVDFNNWIVVWGKFTKDDEFTIYHRFPKKGEANKFIGEEIVKKEKGGRR